MKKIFIGSLVIMTLILGGCSSGSTATTPSTSATASTATSPSSTSSSSSSATTSSKDMTLDELKKYNGKNGNPAYVAVNGTIYDVTNAKGWRNGAHKNGVVAGVDLTKVIGDSPHGDSVLKDLPVIGKIK